MKIDTSTRKCTITAYYARYLKNSIRPPSWLAFIMLLMPPTCINPKTITMTIEAAVKTL